MAALVGGVRLLVLIAVAAVALGSPARRAGSGDPSVVDRGLAGTISHPSGPPHWGARLPDVVVVLSQEGQPERRATTGAEGEFSFDVRPGSYALRVEGPGIGQDPPAGGDRVCSAQHRCAAACAALAS